MQEDLAPLGYSTVQEAIADGWDSAEWFAERDRLQSEEESHLYLLQQKKEIVKDLEKVTVCAEGDVKKIYNAINFIERNVK